MESNLGKEKPQQASCNVKIYKGMKITVTCTDVGTDQVAKSKVAQDEQGLGQGSVPDAAGDSGDGQISSPSTGIGPDGATSS
jgi:hypothetical protein